jgi:methylenetetrahydrofolate dehydrogenase (NADP+) / methenyltetrahydrofolate cyclohydrolase
MVVGRPLRAQRFQHNRMSAQHDQLRIPGRAILREVLAAYQPFQAAIRNRQIRVLILRFVATGDPTATWASRMQASAVSAQQKVAVFTSLGAEVENVVLPDTVAAAEFVDRIEAANTDPRFAAIIVQTPPPARLLAELDRIAPAKDIDALGQDSPRLACATAEGITKIAAPFLGPATTTAVVGSRGFVGSGVVAQLHRQGHTVLELDAGDDLRRAREADIVISTTGRAGLLTTEHLHSGHRLVIDSGFVPYPTGPVGDVHPSAQHLPQAITPVPGGIGPVEMATLAERFVIQQASPRLASWRYLAPTDDGRPLTTAERDVQAVATAPRADAVQTAAKALGIEQSRTRTSAPGARPQLPPRPEDHRRDQSRRR